jgi:hypothetical protein
MSLVQPGQQSRLVAALFVASRHKLLRVFFHQGVAGAQLGVFEETRQTAMNPAVVDAFVC